MWLLRYCPIRPMVICVSATDIASVNLDVGLFDRLLADKGAHTDAKRAELLDSDRTTVWRWRNRRLKPSLDQAVRIASFLDVSVEELFPKQVTDE